MKLRLAIEECGDEGGALTCHLLAPDAGVAATIAGFLRGTKAEEQGIGPPLVLQYTATEIEPT